MLSASTYFFLLSSLTSSSCCHHPQYHLSLSSFIFPPDLILNIFNGERHQGPAAQQCAGTGNCHVAQATFSSSCRHPKHPLPLNLIPNILLPFTSTLSSSCHPSSTFSSSCRHPQHSLPPNLILNIVLPFILNILFLLPPILKDTPCGE